MKKILFVFITLISTNVIGQHNDALASQKENFKIAEELLNNLEGREALYYYHQVYFNNFKNDLETKAKIKIDSLFPVYQKKEFSKWKGKWKLKQLRTNLFKFEKIVISENKISFYDQFNDLTASRIESIYHTKYKPRDFLVNINSLRFNNNEIWEFRTEKTNNESRLFPNLITNSVGISWTLSDERAMIVDLNKRKKALSKEIRTYYIKIE